MSTHTIAGTVLTMPIRVRHADMHVAAFSVDADAAQRMIDYSGLKVCRHRPGRTVATLMAVRYHDGDLGRYHEYGTGVMVAPPGAPDRGMRALASAGAFIHHLPVDQEFTLEAGRNIWGFPKELADFTVREGSAFSFDVGIDGARIARMEFGRALPLPSPLPLSRGLSAYSHTGGATREIPWRMRLSGLRLRPGGVTVTLGDHPYADELRALGLPRRAMSAVSASKVAMAFYDARTLGG